MALVRKKPGGSGAAPSADMPVVSSPRVVSLPMEKSVPKSDLSDFTMLIYGEKKIGKTSLAAQFPDALFMMFEPGGKGLSIYQRDIVTWKEFKEYIKLLKQTDQFKTIIIDTVDIAYERCMTFIGNREGFDHPSEVNDYGKSWQAIAKEFEVVILDLISTGRGVMFISHAKVADFETASGTKISKIIPTMSGQANKFVAGFVDVIAYYGYYGPDRLLTIRGSDMVDAGHRVEGRFIVPGVGEEEDENVMHIPMGNSPKQGYANILLAFDNKQEETYESDITTILSNTKAKAKDKDKKK